MNEALAAGLAEDLDGNFESLVREHQDRLYGLALRSLGNASDAEELTQDAFVRAYRALSGYDRERRRSLQLRPWLTTIVLNLCRNRARRSRLRSVALDGAPELGTADRAASGGQPEARALRREEHEALARRLRALPARYREPLLLRYVGDLAYAEMATALDIPEGTLRAQVHRGLALLRTTLEHDAPGLSVRRPVLRRQEVAS